MTRFKHRLGGLLRWLGSLFVVLFLVALGEALPPLRAFDRLLAENEIVRSILLWTTIGLTALGLIWLIGTPLILRDGNTSPGGGMRLEFSDEASLTEVKRALREGTYRTSLRWRRMFLMMLAGLCLTVGLFGLFVVIGPPGIKFLSLCALGYAGARITLALLRTP